MEDNEYVGRQVVMRNDSRFRDQAYNKGGDGIGEITKLLNTPGPGLSDNFCFKIIWNNGFSESYRLQDVIILDEKRKKRKNPEIDPYDEEDWGYEITENLNENSQYDFLKTVAITYSDRDEMAKIIMKLQELGFKTYKTLDYYVNNRNLYKFFYYHAGDQAFVRCDDDDKLDDMKELSFKKFMELGDKKYKKIENTNKEIDPYDEEDWTYTFF